MKAATCLSFCSTGQATDNVSTFQVCQATDNVFQVCIASGTCPLRPAWLAPHEARAKTGTFHSTFKAAILCAGHDGRWWWMVVLSWA